MSRSDLPSSARIGDESRIGSIDDSDKLSRNVRKAVEEGHAVQVVTTQTDKTHSFKLNVQALEKVLLQKSVRDKNVVVVSVAGAFRKGKSFLLDFLIRYLNSEDKAGWIGDDDSPLTGFPWRGGSERDTTGILLWSKVFPVELENGDEVAVILMDTQGAFDSESTVKDCATVFALSTMLSSVQVFNLSQNIQEDNLQHLELFTEYGRLALEGMDAKPFQKLLFLVRDWSFAYEFDYGMVGGQKILEKKLLVNDKQHPELQQIRQHIHSCFSSIQCFLMPHPGLKVANNPKFDGRLSDIESDFKAQLETLVPSILSPENLVIKKINDKNINGRELVEYFKVYTKIYQSDALPEPKSMLQATAEANNLAAIASAKALYASMMEGICGGDKAYMAAQELEIKHFQIKDKAIKQFRTTRKMGGEDFSRMYEVKLYAEMEETFKNFQKHNEAKNVFVAFRTPAVLFGVVVICYLFSGIFGAIGIYPLANLINMCMGVGLLLLCLWGYIRYSGELREMGQNIDSVAALILELTRQVLTQLATAANTQVLEEQKND